MVEPGGAEGGSAVNVQLARGCVCPKAESAHRSSSVERKINLLADGVGRVPAQFVFDPLVDFAARKLRGDTNGVLNGVRIRPAVADDAAAAHAEQRSAAVLRVIEALLESDEG